MTVDFIASLPKIEGKYRFDSSLSSMCWFKVGGGADVVFIPKNAKDLKLFLHNKPKGIPCTVIGAGSNILVRDRGIKGIVIKLGRGFNYISHDDEHVTVGAAVMDINVALYAQEYGLYGLEFLAGIPGNIGGALVMNAGAYGSDISQILHSAAAINKNDGQIKDFYVEEIGYKYRGNSLGNEWIFIEAKFKNLGYGDKELIKSKVMQIKQERLDTQPVKSRTGGSTFKNPEEQKAWELIDQAGCRGLTIGGAQVSDKHCNFIINNGDATAQDIEDLIITVQKRVHENSGVTLEPEIKILGENK